MRSARTPCDVFRGLLESLGGSGPLLRRAFHGGCRAQRSAKRLEPPFSRIAARRDGVGLSVNRPDVRLLAVLAALLHILTPAIAARTPSASLGVAGLVCTPQGDLTFAGREAVRELAGLLEGLAAQAPGERSEASGAHCPFCLNLDDSEPPTTSRLLAGMEFTEPVFHYTAFELSAAREGGPPIGGRAPPVFS